MVIELVLVFMLIEKSYKPTVMAVPTPVRLNYCVGRYRADMALLTCRTMAGKIYDVNIYGDTEA